MPLSLIHISTKVTAYVGPEQEYFLVDREKYLKRRDLIYTGRTLFGAPAPKGQEMDDQYFGVIRERVGAFMQDLNVELWKLGDVYKRQGSGCSIIGTNADFND